VVTNLDTPALRRLLDQRDDVQVLEVLPEAEFRDEHLEGARNLPLTDLTRKRIEEEGLDPDKPTVVYCFDLQCDLSPRAAHRLEALGFTDVSDYVPGKAAWLGDGLPSDGRRRPEQRVGAVADPDAAIVRADATVDDAAQVFTDTDSDIAIVLNEHDVVLGLLRRETCALDPKTPVVDVVRPGPPTFRPSMTVRELVQWFQKTDQAQAIITNNGGEWIGVIRRDDVLP
jgi:rhodanese-related sulfurtransferase/CBS domain-containing protein